MNKTAQKLTALFMDVATLPKNYACSLYRTYNDNKSPDYFDTVVAPYSCVASLAIITSVSPILLALTTAYAVTATCIHLGVKPKDLIRELTQNTDMHDLFPRTTALKAKQATSPK